MGDGAIKPGPLTTVLIPTRDRPGPLKQALGSALGQRGVELEVLVIDDGSEEPVSQLLEASADSRARVIRLNGGGVAAARNAGLAAARGEWVAFLDDDDSWHPDKLRAQLTRVSETGARWGWCSTELIDAIDGPIGVAAARPAEQIGHLLTLDNAISGSASSVVAQTSLVRELGGFDESLDHLADWDLWIRIAAVAPGTACEQVLVTQRIHSGGMHSRKTTEALEEFSRFRVKHPEVRAEDYLRWIMAAHARAGHRSWAIRDGLRGSLRYREWPGLDSFRAVLRTPRRERRRADRGRGG